MVKCQIGRILVLFKSGGHKVSPISVGYEVSGIRNLRQI